MKISSQEEYGLRIMLRLAKTDDDSGLTINDLSELENMSTANTAKILRILRIGGFVESTRGNTGGYELSMKPSAIKVGDILKSLGGNLYDEQFCDNFKGVGELCNNSLDCTVRSLWKLIQHSVDRVVMPMTLAELISPEEQFRKSVQENLNKSIKA